MEQEEEGHLLADLSFLDFYLHRSIMIRLECFGKKDQASVSLLRQAEVQCYMVEGIAGALLNFLIPLRSAQVADSKIWWISRGHSF